MKKQQPYYKSNIIFKPSSRIQLFPAPVSVGAWSLQEKQTTELLWEKCLAACQVSPGHDWWVQGELETRKQEVRGLPLLTIIASVPQLAYKYSVRSITQDFSPQPLAVIPLLHPPPRILHWDPARSGLSHTELCFSCSGNTPHWSQWEVCDVTPQHRCPCWDQHALLKGHSSLLPLWGNAVTWTPPRPCRSRGDGFSFLPP